MNLSTSRDPGIPEYDATRDKNCPLAQSRKFQRQLKRLREREALGSSHGGSLERPTDEEEELLGLSAPAMGSRTPNHALSPIRRHSPRLLAPIERSASQQFGELPPPGKKKKKKKGARRRLLEQQRLSNKIAPPAFTLSTRSGGITYSEQQPSMPAASVSPAEELEVLKAIILRESYLRRLEEALNGHLKRQAAGDQIDRQQRRAVKKKKKKKKKLPAGLLDLLDLIRVATLEVVEMIERWRLAAKDSGTKRPFLWNDLNYLLKVPSDLDGLDLFATLREWLGFSLLRNPFLLPLPMEHGVNAGVSDKARLLDGGFTKIGDRATSSEGAALEETAALIARAPLEPAKGPYQTPVVNDSLLVNPTATKLVKKQEEEVAVAETPSDLTASVIGDAEMIRIRAAEAVILAEESRSGRFTRDEDRLISEGVEFKRRFAKSLEVDRGVPLTEAAKATPEMAPFAEIAGVGHQPALTDAESTATARRHFENATRKKTEKELSDKVKLLTEEEKERAREEEALIEDGWGPSTDAMAAMRHGGALSELKTMTTHGRRRPPTQRSRGSQLDADIPRLRREAHRLKTEADEIRAECSADLAEADMLEKQGEEEKSTKLREEVEKREYEAQELDEESNLAKSQAASRDRERFEMKRSMRFLEDKKKAARLEAERRKLAEGHVHPLDEDVALTLEDVSATGINRIVRGKLGRFFFAKRILACTKAATLISAAGRGRRDRKRSRLLKGLKTAAVTIQRLIRGAKERVKFLTMRSAANFSKAACKIAALHRGRKARRRVQRRRELKEVSLDCAMAVHVRRLFPADLQELAEAIRLPSVDSKLRFPPAAVLGLVRVIALLLSPGGQGEVVSEYTSVGNKQLRRVDRADLTWTGAMKVLRRSHRLLRRLRALAAGPASTPPRLLQVPREAIELMEAYKSDPTMSLEAMRCVGDGAKAATKLFEFVHGLTKVQTLQTDFFEDLGGDDATPPWLVRRRRGARKRRELHLEFLIDGQATSRAEASCRQRKVQGFKFQTHADCLSQERELEEASKARLAAQDAAEDAHLADSNRRMVMETQRAESDLGLRQRAVEETDARLEDALEICRASTAAESTSVRIPGHRADCAEARVAERESRVQLALARRAGELAAKRRAQVIVDLPSEIKYRCLAAGEARAESRLAERLRLEFFRLEGGAEAFVRRQASLSNGTDLAKMPEAQMLELQELDQRCEDTSVREKLSREAALRLLEELELEISKAEDEDRRRDALPPNLAAPSDEELAEDTREDEQCAMEELRASRRHVPQEYLPSLLMDGKEEEPVLVVHPLDSQEAKANSLNWILSYPSDDNAVVPRRKQPVMVMISGCVPTAAKQKIMGRLESEFEGLFVRVDTLSTRSSDVGPMGVDTMALQAPLVLGKSVVCEVDAGLTRDDRQRFVQAAFMAKHALLPTPRLVLVLGDSRNRAGPPMPKAGYFGVDPRELSRLHNGSLKAAMEAAAEELATLMSPSALQNLSLWAKSPTPPTRAHSMAMEAVIILVQKSVDFRGPEEKDSTKRRRAVTALSWKAARRMLSRPMELVSKLRDCDPEHVPPATLFTVRSYRASPAWPANAHTLYPTKKQEEEEEEERTESTFESKADLRGDDGLALGPLLRWVEAVVTLADILAQHGGHAPLLSRREPADLFSSVVTVHDGRDVDDEESEATGPRGWISAFARLAEAVLEDVRAHRAASKLTATVSATVQKSNTSCLLPSKEAVYNVNVYHDCGRVYFSAYDSSKSVSYFTSVAERQVDRLLAPNSIERLAHAVKSPPKSIKEMYSRLVSMLSLERGVTAHDTAMIAQRFNHRRIKPFRPYSVEEEAVTLVETTEKLAHNPPRLVCRRKLHRLLRCSRRVCGYIATMTVYEDARGELRVHVYINERGASLEILVSSSESTGALAMLKASRNAPKCFLERDALESLNARRMLPFLADRIEIKPSRSQAAIFNGNLSLRLRKSQGPGRRLFRAKPVRVSGLDLLLTCYECADSGVLRCVAYDPRSSETRELRLLPNHRLALLGSLASDHRAWHPELMRRLTTRRLATGDPRSLGLLSVAFFGLDSTLHRAVRKIRGRRCRISLELDADGESLRFRTFDLAGKKQQEEATFLVGPRRLSRIWRSGAESPVGSVLCGDGKKDLVCGNNQPRVSLAKSSAVDCLLAALDRDSSGNVCLPDDDEEQDHAPLSVTEWARHPKAFGIGDGPSSLLFGRSELKELPAHDGTAISALRTGLRQSVVKEQETSGDDLSEEYRKYKGKIVSAEDLLRIAHDKEHQLVAEAAPEPEECFEEVLQLEEEEIIEEEAVMVPLVTAVETRLIYQQGVRVLVEPLIDTGEGTLREAVFVKVWEVYSAGGRAEKVWRFELYRAKTSASTFASIEGLAALRRVMGPKAQHLLAAEREEEMLAFILTERLILQEEADGFRASFRSDKLFDASKKVTPLGLGGEEDADANLDLLFKQGGAARGNKILRQALAIDGVIFHVVVFEVLADILIEQQDEEHVPSGPPLSSNAVFDPASGDWYERDEVGDMKWIAAGSNKEEKELPTLRYVCYNPRAGNTQILFVRPNEITELLLVKDDAVYEAGLIRNRLELARFVSSYFRLNFFRRAPPEVFLPQPRNVANEPTVNGADPEPETLEDGGTHHGPSKGQEHQSLRRPGEERSEAERSRKRPDRLIQMPTRIYESDGKLQHAVIASVFVAPEAQDLDVNVYISRFQLSVETRVSASEQTATLGKTILSLGEGEPRSSGLAWLLRHLRLSNVPTLEDHRRRQDAEEDGEEAVILPPLQLNFSADPKKPWLDAYRKLDSSVAVPVARPTGIPEVFFPSDTKGEELLRKGRRLPNGGDCVITVYSRAPGEPPGHGLVFDCYDPQTSHQAVLHLGAAEIDNHARQSDFTPDNLKATLTKFLAKLKIDHNFAGGLKLDIERAPSHK